MSRTFNFAVLVAVALLVVVLTLGAVLNSHNLGQVLKDAHLVEHTHRVRESIATMKAMLYKAGMRQRGYLLTGDIGYQTAMNQAVESLRSEAAALRGATSDNRRQQKSLDTWDRQLTSYVESLQSGIALRDQGVELAALVRASDETRERLSSLEQVATAMQEEENRLLESRSERLTSAYYFAAAAAVCMVALGLLVFWMLLRIVQKNMAAQAKVATSIHSERERLRVTLSSIGDAVISTDDREQITFINPVAQQLTAWNASEAVGQPLNRVLNLLDERTGKPTSSPIAEVLASRDVVRMSNHTLLVGRDGVSHSISDSAAPIISPDGSLSGAVLVFRDVSEERDLSMKLRERDEYIRNVIDSTFEGIYSIDLEGRCTFCNPACLRLLGYESSVDFVGKVAHDIIHYARPDGSPLPLTDCRIHLAMSAGKAVHVTDEHFWRSNGVCFPVEYRCHPVRRGHDVIGSVISFRDVSEDRSNEQVRVEHARMAGLRAEIASHLACADDFNAGLGKCVEAIVHSCSAGAAQVWTSDEDRFVADLKSGAGLTADGDVSTDADDKLAPKLTGSGSFSGLSLCETSSDSRLGGISFGAHEEGMIFHGFSMEINENSVGVLGVFRKEPLTQIESSELTLVANQMAQFIVRHRAMNALAENERQFREWADSIPQLAWMAQPDGGVFWYNQRWFDFTGTTLEEMQGWGWQSVHDPELLPAVLKKFKNSIASGAAWEDTFPLRRADGVFRWHLSRALPMRDSSGAIVRWFGTNTDVTEIREAEEALRDSEGRFRELAEAMPQIVWVADRAGHIQYFNQRWFDYTSSDETESYDEAWKSRLHPDDYQKTTTGWRQAVKAGEPFESEYRIQSKTGEHRWFLRRAIPIRDSLGHVVRWLGTSTDIHDRRVLEERLKGEADQKDRFLATLAHELRNPLAPLSGALQLITMHPEAAEKNAEYAQLASRQCDQLTRLLDDLLDISRISTGKVRLQREPIDLGPVVTTAVETAKPFIEQAQHQLSVVMPTSAVYVHGDPVRLAQVITNLLVNAAKYTPPGGKIEICSAQSDSIVSLSVSDNGVGIPAEMIDRVFDLFAQVDSSATRTQGGLGIGLTLVKTLVELHDGKVLVSSGGIGAGSTFTIELPTIAAGRSIRRPGESDAMLEATPLPTRRVLVVDDSPSVALMLTRLLENLGQAVEMTNDPHDALRRIANDPPEIVFSDIAMPGMTGYQMVQEIEAPQLPKQPLLIAVTGYGQASDRREALMAGFDEHVVKPIGVATLRRLLAQEVRSAEPKGEG